MTTLIKLGEVNRFCAVLISRLTGSKAVWTLTTSPRLDYRLALLSTGAVPEAKTKSSDLTTALESKMCKSN